MPDKKQKIKTVAERLSHIGVLIADEDQRISTIVREVLESVGFSNIHMAKDGARALDIIKSESIDMLITDWRMQPMDGVSLVNYLRTSVHSPNRFIPIIMLTGNAEREHVEMARDVGVTEFVVKPFSARTLCSRIALVIDNPRSFVLSSQYAGPDRRRRAAVPPDGQDKRQSKGS